MEPSVTNHHPELQQIPRPFLTLDDLGFCQTDDLNNSRLKAAGIALMLFPAFVIFTVQAAQLTGGDDPNLPNHKIITTIALAIISGLMMCIASVIWSPPRNLDE